MQWRIASDGCRFTKHSARFDSISPGARRNQGRAFLNAITKLQVAIACKRPPLRPTITPEASLGSGPSLVLQVLHVNNSPEWGSKLMGKTFDGVVREFIRTLLDSLPGSAPEDVFWGYNFLTGAMTLADMMCSRMGFAARVMLQL
jgi:hypothetical protein